MGTSGPPPRGSSMQHPPTALTHPHKQPPAALEDASDGSRAALYLLLGGVLFAMVVITGSVYCYCKHKDHWMQRLPPSPHKAAETDVEGAQQSSGSEQWTSSSAQRA